MRFIHTADLHLDAPVGGLPQRAAVRRSALEALGQMIDYAKANGIGYMVIAGDLFDRPDPNPAISGAVQRLLAAAEEICFILVAGNHDPLPARGDWCGIKLPENVHLLGRETEQLFVSDGSFVGASLYEGMARHPFAGALPEKSGWSVGVFHGSVGDSEAAHRLEAEAVRCSGLDYLALGHTHKGAEPARLGTTVVGVCGSPAAHGFDEPGRRSFLDVTVDGNGVSAKRVFTRGVCFYEDELTVEEQDSQGDILGKMIARCMAHGAEDIYRFRVTGTTAKPLPASLPDYPALVEIIDQTTLPMSLEKLAAEHTLRGYFVKGMLQQLQQAPSEKRALYEAALRLGLEAFE